MHLAWISYVHNNSQEGRKVHPAVSSTIKGSFVVCTISFFCCCHRLIAGSEDQKYLDISIASFAFKFLFLNLFLYAQHRNTLSKTRCWALWIWNIYFTALCSVTYWSWKLDKSWACWILWIFPWSFHEIKVCNSIVQRKKKLHTDTLCFQF